MSTYLQLVQKFQRDCGVSGAQISTVSSQTGEANRLVNWIAEIYKEIQNKYPNWRWLRSRFTVNTVADTAAYAATDCTDSIASSAITRFRRWWPLDDAGYSNVTYYLSSAGTGQEGYLPYLDWFRFRDLYMRGTQTSQQPAHFTIDPQNNLRLGPAPDDVYVVSGEYQKSAQILAANDDTPEMPSDFHDLIVYEAMMKRYAPFESAPEVYDQARLSGMALWRQLELDQLPEPCNAEPLA